MEPPTARSELGLLPLGGAGGWIWAFTCPTPDCACRPALVLWAPGDRVGRNEVCPCGSGKKFKKCCGAA